MATDGSIPVIDAGGRRRGAGLYEPPVLSCPSPESARCRLRITRGNATAGHQLRRLHAHFIPCSPRRPSDVMPNSEPAAVTTRVSATALVDPAHPLSKEEAARHRHPGQGQCPDSRSNPVRTSMRYGTRGQSSTRPSGNGMRRSAITKARILSIDSTNTKAKFNLAEMSFMQKASTMRPEDRFRGAGAGRGTGRSLRVQGLPLRSVRRPAWMPPRRSSTPSIRSARNASYYFANRGLVAQLTSKREEARGLA